MTSAKMKARLSRLEDKENPDKGKYTRYLFSSLSPQDQQRMMRFEFSYECGPDDRDKQMAKAMGWELNHARAYIIRNDVEMTREETARKARGESDPLEGGPVRDLTDSELRAFGLAVLDEVLDPAGFARRIGWSIGQLEAFHERLADWDAQPPCNESDWRSDAGTDARMLGEGNARAV